VIDLETGELKLITGGRIGPLTRLETFRESIAGAGAEEVFHEGEWQAYRLLAAERPGRLFAVLLHFKGSQLLDLKLALHCDRFGGTREHWSQAGEQARKRAHDQVLASIFGALPPYDLGWGTIQSVVGADGGTSVIWIRYRPPALA